MLGEIFLKYATFFFKEECGWKLEYWKNLELECRGAFRKPCNEWGSDKIMVVKSTHKCGIPWKYTQHSTVSRLFSSVVAQVARSIAICSCSYNNRVPAVLPLCPTLILTGQIRQVVWTLSYVFLVAIEIILILMTVTSSPCFFQLLPNFHRQFCEILGAGVS